MRAVFDQLVHAGVDDLHRQGCRQFGQRSGELTLNFCNRGFTAGDLNSQGDGNGGGLGRDGASKHHEPRLSVGDQPLRVARPKGAAPSQEEDGFEQGCLARTVCADDEIAPGMQLDLRMAQAAQVLERQ